jgi:hypothetical protein
MNASSNHGLFCIQLISGLIIPQKAVAEKWEALAYEVNDFSNDILGCDNGKNAE